MLIEIVLNQMAFLFLLIAIGYVLAKLKLVPEGTEGILSKLESYVFIPALVMGTFMNNFTVDRLSSAKTVLIGSIIVLAAVIPLSVLITHLVSKDRYIRHIYLYGLTFSNFSFMGNAIVSAIFPDIFLEYLLFTMVLWIAIYVWGIPSLLLGTTDQKHGIKSRLKNFVNPMIIAMFIGMIIGLLGVKLPSFASNLVVSLGDCMSPVAMLLTGITLARKSIKSLLKIKSVYVITFVRLIAYPLLFIGVTKFINLPETLVICILSSLAMPLGLNTIVIPAAYGKDTTTASSMALISHLLSCITIPLIFLFIN